MKFQTCGHKNSEENPLEDLVIDNGHALFRYFGFMSKWGRLYPEAGYWGTQADGQIRVEVKGADFHTPANVLGVLEAANVFLFCRNSLNHFYL